MNSNPILLLTFSLCALGAPAADAAIKYVDLAGPATGYLAIANFKNSPTKEGIEGIGNGLPAYPNYLIPAGSTNAGRYTAIVASPMAPGADYSPFFGGTINNATTVDANHSTMSAGLIGFDDSSLTGIGAETLPVSALNFNFDTLSWDGTTANGWEVFDSPVNISPFSAIHTDYNAGGGAGNASVIYNLSLSNITGNGLSFQDGQLVSMDIAGTLSVMMRIGNFPFAGSVTFTGDFSTSGLGYQFDLDDTESIAIFTGIHMIMNRAGTASVIPEPAAALLGGLGALALFRRRR